MCAPGRRGRKKGCAPEPAAQFMQQAESEEHVGENNICGSIAEALERARWPAEQLLIARRVVLLAQT